jgi:outer membrane protein assembly factor BamD (BamD/ComL family)
MSSGEMAMPEACRSLNDIKARYITGEHAFKLLIMAGYREMVNGESQTKIENKHILVRLYFIVFFSVIVFRLP